MTSSTICPICDAPVSVGSDTVVDELLECSDCGCELVVMSVLPLGLEEAPMAEEDWGQ